MAAPLGEIDWKQDPFEGGHTGSPFTPHRPEVGAGGVPPGDPASRWSFRLRKMQASGHRAFAPAAASNVRCAAGYAARPTGGSPTRPCPPAPHRSNLPPKT